MGPPPGPPRLFLQAIQNALKGRKSFVRAHPDNKNHTSFPVPKYLHGVNALTDAARSHQHNAGMFHRRRAFAPT
jgi:hypothetical protein